MQPYNNDEFSQYLVESTANYFDRYGSMYGSTYTENDVLDEELDEIINNLLDEGYSVSECIDILESLNEEDFIEILDEAIRLTPKQAKAEKQRRASERQARSAADTGKIAAARQQRKAERKQVQSAQRAAKVAKVKGAIVGKAQSVFRRAKAAAGQAKDTATRAGMRVQARMDAAGKKAGEKALAGYQAARGKASAVKAGAQQRATAGYQAIRSKASAAKAGIQQQASAAKAGTKQRIGKALLKGAQKLTRGAARMGVSEEMDIFDAVLQYILDEGYAVSFQEAYQIMSELDDETIDDILEEVGFEYIEE